MQPAGDLKTTWNLDLAAVACAHCGWGYLAPAGPAQSVCPHCSTGRLDLVADPGPLAYYPPELLTPFSMTPEELNQAVAGFASGIPYPPTDLAANTLASRMQRIYVPMWMVDIEVEAEWQAEAGFNYEVVSHQERYAAGGWQTQEVTETRVRWEPRLGRLKRAYANLAVPALDEAAGIEQAVGKLTSIQVERYQPEQVAGAFICLPDRTPEDAWGDALPILQRLAADEVQKAAQADHVREFRWRAQIPARTWTQLLAPIYASYYQDDEGRVQTVLLHGETGKMWGSRRASMRRAQHAALVILAAGLGLFTLGVIFGLVSLVAPPLLAIAGILVVLAVLVGVGAVIPIARAWQFNRKPA